MMFRSSAFAVVVCLLVGNLFAAEPLKFANPLIVWNEQRQIMDRFFAARTKAANDPQALAAALAERDAGLSQLAAAAEAANSKEYRQLAIVYSILNRYDDSARQARTAIEIQATDFGAQSLLIQALVSSKQTDEALKAFRQLAKIEVPVADASGYLGVVSNIVPPLVNALVDANRQTEAGEVLDAHLAQLAKLQLLLDKMPTGKPTLTTSTAKALANSLRTRVQSKKPPTVATTSPAKPAEPAATPSLIVGKEHDAIMNRFFAARTKAGNDPQALAAAESGRDDALSQLAAAAEAAKSQEHRELAILYSTLKRYDDSVRQARAAIEIEATDFGAQSVLIKTLISAKQTDEALQAFYQLTGREVPVTSAGKYLAVVPNIMTPLVDMLADSNQPKEAGEVLDAWLAQLDKLQAHLDKTPTGQPPLSTITAKGSVNSLRLRMQNKKPPTVATTSPAKPATGTTKPAIDPSKLAAATERMKKSESTRMANKVAVASKTPLVVLKLDVLAEYRGIGMKFDNASAAARAKNPSNPDFAAAEANRTESLNKLAERFESEKSTDHGAMALVYADLNRFDDAVREAEIAIAEKPSSWTARLSLANVLRRAKRPYAAAGAFGNFVETSIPYDDAKNYLSSSQTDVPVMVNFLAEANDLADAAQSLRAWEDQLGQLESEIASTNPLLIREKVSFDPARKTLADLRSSPALSALPAEPAAVATRSPRLESRPWGFAREMKAIFDLYGGPQDAAKIAVDSHRVAARKEALAQLATVAERENSTDHVFLLSLYMALERSADADREVELLRAAPQMNHATLLKLFATLKRSADADREAQAEIEASSPGITSQIWLTKLLAETGRNDHMLVVVRKWLAQDVAPGVGTEYLSAVASFGPMEHVVRALLEVNRFKDSQRIVDEWEAKCLKVQQQAEKALSSGTLIQQKALNYAVVDFRTGLSSMRMEIKAKKIATPLERVNGRIVFFEPFDIVLERQRIFKEGERRDSLAQLLAAAETAKVADGEPLRLLREAVKKYDEDVDRAQKLVAEKPTQWFAYKSLIVALNKSDRTEEAQEAYRAAYKNGSTPGFLEKLVHELLRLERFADVESLLATWQEQLDFSLAAAKEPDSKKQLTEQKLLLAALLTEVNYKRTRSQLFGKAAPPLVGESWVNGPALSFKDLQGKVVWVLFSDFSPRTRGVTSPYVRDWQAKYGPQGLVIVCVTPRIDNLYDWELATHELDAATKERLAKEVKATKKSIDSALEKEQREAVTKQAGGVTFIRADSHAKIAQLMQQAAKNKVFNAYEKERQGLVKPASPVPLKPAEQDAKILQLMEQEGLKIRTLVESANKELSAPYAVPEFPFAVLIDKRGEIQRIDAGYSEQMYEEIEADLQRQFPPSASPSAVAASGRQAERGERGDSQAFTIRRAINDIYKQYGLPGTPSTNPKRQEALAQLAALAEEQKSSDHAGLLLLYSALKRTADADREARAVAQAAGPDVLSQIELTKLFSEAGRTDDALAAARRWVALEIPPTEGKKYFDAIQSNGRDSEGLSSTCMEAVVKLLLQAGRISESRSFADDWETQFHKLQLQREELAISDGRGDAGIQFSEIKLAVVRRPIYQTRLLQPLKRVNGRVVFDEPLDIAFERIRIRKQGNSADALAQLATAAEAAKSTEHRELWGLYLELGRHDDAIRLAKAEIEAKPDDSEAQSDLIITFLAAKQTDEALTAYRAASEKQGADQANFLFLVVARLEDLHRYADAEMLLADWKKQLDRTLADSKDPETVKRVTTQKEQAVQRLESLAQHRQRFELMGHASPPLVGESWVNGPALRPQDLKGKVVWIFFSDFSPEVRNSSVPQMLAWHDKYSAQGLVIVVVTQRFDTLEAWEKLTWELDDDWKNKRANYLKNGIPLDVVKGMENAQQKIHFESIQGLPLKPAEQDAKILALLQKDGLKNRTLVESAKKEMSGAFLPTGVTYAVLIDKQGVIRRIDERCAKETYPEIEAEIRKQLGLKD